MSTVVVLDRLAVSSRLVLYEPGQGRDGGYPDPGGVLLLTHAVSHCQWAPAD